MLITVEITQSELEDFECSSRELEWCILEDLDQARDYPGFNVKVIVTEQDKTYDV